MRTLATAILVLSFATASAGAQECRGIRGAVDDISGCISHMAQSAGSGSDHAHFQGTASETDFRTAIQVAFGLPRIVAMNVYMSRTLIVEAVYQATTLSGGGMVGRIVNTGTLSPGFGGGYQYSPEPTDRLVLNTGPGQTHEFVVRQAQGNSYAATASAWMASPHYLQYSHRLPGLAEGEITAQFDGSRFEVHVRGWYTQSGTRYDIDMRAAGQTSGSSGYDGQDSQTQYDVFGTISGGDLTIDVQERHSSSMASATSLRLLPSQRGSASRFNAVLNNVLIVGGEEYSFQNVQVQTDQRTRGTQTGQAGMTHLDGVLLRSGQSFGRFVLQGGRAFLQSPSGLVALDMPVPGGGSS